MFWASERCSNFAIYTRQYPKNILKCEDPKVGHSGLPQWGEGGSANLTLFLTVLSCVKVRRWGGARLFAASEGHPHENGCNSETKSQKIDPKVPNRRGLQTCYCEIRLSAKRENGRFSVIRTGIGRPLVLGHFFGDPYNPTKFP